jgi:1,4-alpha-glucan branching enzyme
MMKECVKDLKLLYKEEPALHELQFESGGFEWIDLSHRNESVMVYRRKGKKKKDDVLIILNMTPVVRNDWKIIVYDKPEWKEIFNSDAKKYWGTGDVFNPEITCELVDKKEKRYEINVQLPALGAVILK